MSLVNISNARVKYVISVILLNAVSTALMRAYEKSVTTNVGSTLLPLFISRHAARKNSSFAVKENDLIKFNKIISFQPMIRITSAWVIQIHFVPVNICLAGVLDYFY